MDEKDFEEYLERDYNAEKADYELEILERIDINEDLQAPVELIGERKVDADVGENVAQMLESYGGDETINLMQTNYGIFEDGPKGRSSDQNSYTSYSEEIKEKEEKTTEE